MGVQNKGCEGEDPGQIVEKLLSSEQCWQVTQIHLNNILPAQAGSIHI